MRIITLRSLLIIYEGEEEWIVESQSVYVLNEPNLYMLLPFKNTIMSYV